MEPSPLATPRLRRLAHAGIYPARSLDRRALGTDLHLHTTYTDGRSSLAEMLAAAPPLATIAFTEHVRRGITWFDSFQRDVACQARAYPHLQVLVGIEAKALDVSGALDADPSLVEQVELVLGAFHNYPDLAGGFISAHEISAEQAAEREFQASCGLLDHPDVDILAHPGALTRKHFGSFPAAYLQELVHKAARVGRAIELNGEYTSTEELEALLRLCQDANAWVSLGSNAHHATEVGRIARRLKELEYVH